MMWAFWALLASLLIMTLGAEVLVRGASALARKFGVSSFFIGLTIVGFGTSAPELATGITAALKGFSDINIGNVVGSNIFNLACTLGITALIAPIIVNARVVRSEVILVIATAFLPLLAGLTGRDITRLEGAVLTACFVAFLIRGYRNGRKEDPKLAEGLAHELEEELAVPGVKTVPAWLAIGLVVAGLALLVAGSHLLVQSSVAIARRFGVSELVIALTIVSAGTSAPELVTSLVAAVRKQPDISIGNILGSNIFNVLAILGITSLVKPQHVSDQVIWFDTPLLIVLSIACLPIMMSHHRISRSEGAVLFAFYIIYTLALYTVIPAWFPANT
ncbi:MAG: calcium/sodium antiporter [Candidatus Hydrogenedentes bacterium]|nr:calcium/sodium antiporter [Candidatus Hydrogenedentota bacterium]